MTAAASAVPGLAFAALPVPAGDLLSFDVLRNGSKIGTHVVRLAPVADQLTVTIAVDLAVGIGPLAFFRYTHRATELWRDDRPFRIQTMTNDDGTPHSMSGELRADGFHVDGDRTKPYVAPQNAMPGSHWNKQMLRAPVLINTQDGRLTHVQVADRGQGSIGGVVATRYSITGELVLDTFYAGERWVGLDFVRSGSRIQYVQSA